MPTNVLVGLALTSQNNSTSTTATFDSLSLNGGGIPTPAAPSGLTTTAGNGSVSLSWSAVSQASGYNVKRATVSGGPYTTIASNLANPAYTDGGLVNGTTYYYVVSATNATGESANSAQSSATPVAPAATWTSNDIGAVAFAGSTSASNGTYTMTASGADIWFNADAFRFMYQPLNGDGSITIRVGSLQRSADWAKAGVMIRESLAPGAANSSLLVSPVSGLAFQWRSSANATSQYLPGSGAPPCWLRLTRTGHVFAAFSSNDGNNWTPLGSTTVVMPTNVLVGLALTSQNNSTSTTATFDSLSVTP
jgi:regulation of enolase protein 1 (concanavalin A-like superfamily)